MFFGEALAKSENISQKVEKNNIPFFKIRNAWKGIFKWNITHFFSHSKRMQSKAEKRKRELNQKTFRKTKCIAAHFSKKANLLFYLVTDEIPESFLNISLFLEFMTCWWIFRMEQATLDMLQKIKKSWFRGYPKIRFQVSYIWH